MSEAIRVRIDLEAETAPFSRFWRSTGFSPAELLLEPEMRQALAHIGGVPHRGIEFLRVHYMLDLVRAHGFGRYDWSLLDAAIDAMAEHRLRPFFELMGNPSGLFGDFSDRDQAHHWRDFIAALAERYRDRCGVQEVAAWYFETWNEPDIWWRHGGEAGFDNYYDACSEALKAVDPALRLGGPGTARTLAPMFKSFLAHCDTGTNLFTGETGVRLDFISVHEKGMKKHAEDLSPDTLNIVAKEMQTVRYVREHHPRFSRLPVINNECDPQIGWILSHTWRGMPYFAGLVAKIVDQHRRLMIEGEGIDYALLSNDNGFIGRWGHRTLLAYFGDREIRPAQAEHRTDLDALAARRAAPKPFDLVKKPALSVMELLACLGDRSLPCTIEEAPSDGRLGILATRRGKAAAILAYNSADRIWRSGRDRVDITLDGLAPGQYAQALFRIEDGRGDPFSAWEALGAPDRPSPDELAQLRLAQEPAQSIEQVTMVHARPHRISIDLLLPGVALLLLVRWGDGPPAAPRAPSLRRDASLHGENVTLFWEPGDDGIVLYDVLWSETEAGPFQPLNAGGLLSTTYVTPEQPGGGWYRIRARDLFGKTACSEAVAA